MEKVNGLLNFVRHVFKDEYSNSYDVTAPIHHSITLPSQRSSSLYGGLDYAAGVGSSWLREYLDVESDLLSRYIDYEEMDDVPEVAGALDIYADDATQPDGLTGKTMRVDCHDETISEILTDLYEKNLRVDEDIWEIARTMCKYGNDFEEIVVREGEGVVDINFMPAPTMRRIEDVDGTLLGFVQDNNANFSISEEEFRKRVSSRAEEIEAISDENAGMGKDGVRVHENWEVVHFRLRSKHRRSLYGFSVLDSSRWVMKRLMLLEDSMLVYRLSRAPERFAFYVDVGDVPPNEALSYVKKVKNEFKKKKWVDPQSNKLDMRYNPLSADEDFFIPVRGDKRSTSIETVGGFNYQGIDDVGYFKDKLYAGLKVPKARLNYSDGWSSRGSLSQEDMNFARSILRIQRELRNGYKKIGRVHLAALGIAPDVVEWELRLNPPSSIFEMAQMEVRNAQLDLAERYKAFASQYWIQKEILHMTDDEIRIINDGRRAEALDTVRYPTAEAREFPRGFFDGNKESEKILKENMDEVLRQNPDLKRRFAELKGLISDLRIHLKK